MRPLMQLYARRSICRYGIVACIGALIDIESKACGYLQSGLTWHYIKDVFSSPIYAEAVLDSTNTQIKNGH